jgi:hypothetical protein
LIFDLYEVIDGDNVFIYRTLLISEGVATYEIEWQFVKNEDDTVTAEFEAIKVFGNYGRFTPLRQVA